MSLRIQMINPPAASGVDMVREGRCMQRAGAWTAVWAPISLATIAAVLEDEGAGCRLDDCIIEGLDKDELLQRARAFQPRMFVINTATPSIDSDLGLADELKKEFPDSKILAIGIHVTALPEQSLKTAAGLDAVVRGEPELTVRDAARAVERGQTLKGIPGMSLRDGDGFSHGPDREPAVLDQLPFPAWGLVKTHLYRMPFSAKPFLLIGTSRGCPYHCTFCADPAYYGHKLRTKSPERVAAEIEHVREEFAIYDFLFWSESFTLNREWAARVLEEIIKLDLGVRFVVNSRTDHVDPELLGLLHRAGCWMIGLGLESGSQRILDLMNKKVTVERNRQAVEQAKKAGLQVTAHMVLGYPGETEDTVRQTIDFACSLPLDYAQFYCAVPFPGSPLFNTASEKGWVEQEPWHRFEQNFAVMDLPGMSPAELQAWRRRAYRRFYASPSRVWRVIRRDVGVRGMPAFARMVIEFRGWV